MLTYVANLTFCAETPYLSFFFTTENNPPWPTPKLISLTPPPSSNPSGPKPSPIPPASGSSNTSWPMGPPHFLSSPKKYPSPDPPFPSTSESSAVTDSSNHSKSIRTPIIHFIRNAAKNWRYDSKTLMVLLLPHDDRVF